MHTVDKKQNSYVKTNIANRVKKLSIPITVNRIMPHHYQKAQKKKF